MKSLFERTPSEHGNGEGPAVGAELADLLCRVVDVPIDARAAQGAARAVPNRHSIQRAVEDKTKPWIQQQR